MCAAETINVGSTHCRRCGMAYSRLKGYFPVSYGYLYKGTGYLPYCKQCVDDMYNEYYNECKDMELAVWQMCRKLDLYWSKALFTSVVQLTGTRSIMTCYLSKINGAKFAGKSYDDSLREQGCFWVRPGSGTPSVVSGEATSDTEALGISEEIITFWGPGYTPAMYQELEQRYHYWLSKLDNHNPDIGIQALLRQIVSMEIDINRDRAAGKNTEKSVKALMDLLGSAQLKPAQRDSADSAFEKTTFGEWIQKWEEGKPIPDPDPELQDVDGIKKYITVWFYGHLCKSLGIKNAYSKLYEEEIARLRVEKPEYDEDDDDAFVDDIFGGVSSE